MHLTTERLDLVPLQLIDLEIFHKTNLHPFVREYLWDNEEIPESVSRDILDEVEKRFNEERWGLWKVVNTNTEDYMGYIGFWFFFEEELPQLLFALLPEFAGYGYATEASQRMIQYAFEELNFPYVVASIDTPNVKSANVCTRLDMELVKEKVIEGKPTLFYRRVNENHIETY